ncbi:MAG: GTP-binding protein [Salinigranum sp.]
MSRDVIPVTILSGSLGAGKTTLLNHLLREATDRKIAVLVNDMGEINVDAAMVQNSEVEVEGGVTELSNGCICCELRDDLETAVVRLARERDFDSLVIEPSGISEPRPIARLFTARSSAAARYDVDAVVTVVDSRQFFDAFGGAGVAERRGPDEEGTRPLSDLLVEQVEFSNVVLLNKTDLVTGEELDAVEELVRSLSPGAEIVRTTHSEVDPDRVLGRDLYDPATMADAAGWQRLLNESADDAERSETETHGEHVRGEEDHGGRDHGDHDGHGHDHGDHDGHGHDHGGHSHPMAEYGVTSFVYRRRRPFHPGRIADLLSNLPEAVVRSKGTCWIAGRDDLVVTYEQAGPSARTTITGRWIAGLPEFEQDAYRRNHPEMKWDDEWGDRRNELVFIGRGMDEAALRAALDDCLLTDEEMAADWSAFENPFPGEAGGERVLVEPTPS